MRASLHLMPMNTLCVGRQAFHDVPSVLAVLHKLCMHLRSSFTACPHPPPAFYLISFHAARLAEARLQRSGRCHESEVRAALGRSLPRYRSSATLSDAALRNMIRNWHPGADRTPQVFLPSLSVLPAIGCAYQDVKSCHYVYLPPHYPEWFASLIVVITLLDKRQHAQ